MMSFTLLSLPIFVLGLIVGSFLNVVICRLNTTKSFGGRSACMSCTSQLCWYELVPLVSFLGLGGRCRNCKTKISIQYPLVELCTGLVFVVVFWKLFNSSGQGADFLFRPTFLLAYIYYIGMFSILIVTTVYDLRHKIIPDLLSFIFGFLAFLGLFFFSHTNFLLHMPTGLELTAGLLVSLPFALLWFVSRGTWMGLGDAKLALGLGWLLGLSLGFSAMVLAFWIGAVASLVLVASSRVLKGYKSYGMKSEIPFALYLALGTLLVFIFEFNFFIF